MTSANNDLYRLSTDDDSITDKSSTRNNRKITLTNKENNSKKNVGHRRRENVSKVEQSRVVTRSSQRSPLIPMNDHTFVLNNNSDFSQFVDQKKRQRNDKKTKTFKRPKSAYDHFH